MDWVFGSCGGEGRAGDLVRRGSGWRKVERCWGYRDIIFGGF